MYKSLGCALCVWSLTAVSADAAHILFTSTGDTNLDALTKSTLESYGHSADIGPRHQDFDANQSLMAYDAVLLLVSTNWTADMPADGQALVLNFVSGGGKLVTGEWLVWCNGAYPFFATLYPAIPVTSTNVYNSASPITYAQVTPAPVLNAGLPPAFTFPADNFAGTETNFAPKPGALIYYDSDNLGAGVIGWGYGAGTVLSFSTTIGPLELQDANYGRLVANAFNFSASTTLGDLNCDGVVNFDDINPFVLALSDPAGYAAQYPNCNILSADCNGDGAVNFDDINPFVAILSG